MSALYQNLSNEAKALRHRVIGDCVLFCADSLEVLPTLGKVDACVTDPPYGIDYKPKTRPNRGYVGGDYPSKFGQIIGDNKPFDPSNILMLGVPTLFWGANNFAHLLPPSAGWICWDKTR